MDRFVGMRTFATVAQSASFTAAAAELGISPSLVSRHIAALEQDVGVQLVLRTPRSVRLTEAGHEYAAFATRLLAELDEEHARLTKTNDADEGKLSVISPKWIGLLDLGSAVSDYLGEHPRTRMRFELGGVSDRVYDFLERGFDVAFHARDLRDSRVKLRRITELEFVLAASPAYIDGVPEPEHPGDLARLDCHMHASDSSWRFWHDGRELAQRIERPGMVTNAYAVIEQLLLDGRGVGMLPRRMAADALAVGELVEVLPAYRPPSRSLYAVHAPGSRTPERVSQFIDFMVEWFRTHETAAPRASAALAAQ